MTIYGEEAKWNVLSLLTFQFKDLYLAKDSLRLLQLSVQLKFGYLTPGSRTVQ